MRRITRRLLIGAAAAATLIALASPANAALSPRAVWNMNSLPRMVDSAGGDNNGTTSNVRLSGGAYKFNGTSSYATAPDAANLDPGSANIRLTARVSITSVPRTGQTYDVVRKGLSPTVGGYYKMEVMRSATGQAIVACRFKDANGRAGEAFGTTAIQNKGFVTISCLKTPTGVTVTTGGQSKSFPKALASISNSSAVFIGGKGDGTDWFPGLMDFVKIEIG